jgi:hypothetical protein
MSFPSSTMPLQKSSKHGSGESDDVDLNPSPSRSTLSTTVSFPPGCQQDPGFHIERNPLLESAGPLEEALLPDTTSLALATPQGLIRYLEYKETPTEAVDQISQHRLTGEQWIGVYGQGEAAAAVAMIMGDFPALPSLRARANMGSAGSSDKEASGCRSRLRRQAISCSGESGQAKCEHRTTSAELEANEGRDCTKAGSAVKCAHVHQQ